MTTTETADLRQKDRMMRYASDIVLRNGSTLQLRPILPEDAPRIFHLLEHLSPGSLQFRFCAARKPDMKAAEEMAKSDPATTFGLVGEVSGQIVAVAHYFRGGADDTIAEAAFTITDSMHGLGIGTRLLEKLAEVGREHGVKAFVAEVLPQNHKMIKVFLDSGFDTRNSSDGEQIHFHLSIEPTESYEARAADRAREAATASMKALFEPRSIAVIGASRRRGRMGAEVFRNLIRSEFKGKLYPVNPMATEVEYVPCFPSVRDIPGDVDLAFVVVPAHEVETVVDDCIEKGVRGIVLLTGGFSERGREGRAREMRLVDKIRAAGIRMVGPNSMGLINTDPEIGMQGTFSPVRPPSGTVAMSTQSGALGLATLDYSRSLNLGFSTVISVGNKADVSGNDLIQYWADDPRTGVILLYLESFGNPKKFGSIARRVARKKPIVAVKSGRSQTGARAALLHTGARAASDVIVADLFRQAGVIRTDTLEEMFDVATLLANQPLPRGRRIAILSNAGGPAILAADACEARGLVVANLQQQTIDRMRQLIPGDGMFDNPIDVTPAAPADCYKRTMDALLADPGVDALLVIHIPIFREELDSIIGGIRDGADQAADKPVIGAIMTSQGVPRSIAPIPCFPFPERAVAALARVANYADWKRRPAGRIRSFDDIDEKAATEIIGRRLEEGEGWLSLDDARALLNVAGIQALPCQPASNASDAVDYARSVGYPVVVKAIVPSIRRGTEVAGMRASLSDDDAVRSAWNEMARRFDGRLLSINVQKMLPEGGEVMVGVTEQPTFGHLLFYGVAGASYDVVPDLSFRFHPVTDLDIADMVDEAHCTASIRRNIDTLAGEPKIRDTLMRLSHLVDLCPEIREMEISPLKVLDDRIVAIEVRVRVGEPEVNGTARRVSY